MLKVYNTLSGKKQTFKPLKKKQVGMYTCGLTVYNYGHLGNYRSFICADIIRRYLEYKGYKVKYVKNITDVGHFTEDDLILGRDKILLAAQKEKKLPSQIVKFYTKVFFEDEKKLNIKKANVYPRASEHIKEIIDLIKILIKKGYAYKISDGIYFQVSKFKNYGKLSGNTLNKLKKGVRIEPNPEKRHPADFALWKFAPPDVKRQMEWDSPWGRGFPGWHIECSAMSIKYLGKNFDIHTGGEDNIFPHHEDEIAQTEASTNKSPFVKYWIHVRHLLIQGKKMAKSQGNFYTIRDLEKRGYSPLFFRLLVLKGYYRSKLNFTFQGLKEAEKNLQQIFEFVEKLEKIKNKKTTKQKFVKSLALQAQKHFEKAMDDDFNTPKAIAVVFELINKGNSLMDKNLLSQNEAGNILEFLKKIDRIFNFIFLAKPKAKIPEEVLELAKERERRREKGDWRKADEIRAKIKKMRYWVEDTKEGSKIKTFGSLQKN